MGNQASNELPEYAQLQMPAVTAAAEVTYNLQTVGCGPSIVGPPSQRPTTRTLPKDIVLKIFTDCCELWSGGTAEAKHPIDRWSLCNIVSWGNNTSAVRFVVLSDQLVPSGPSESAAVPTIVRTRATYDFQTKQGSEIVECLKKITSSLASELRKHMKLKAPNTDGVKQEDLPITPTGKKAKTAPVLAPSLSLIERSDPLSPEVAQVNAFKRTHSTLLSAEAGLPIDTIREALLQEGREPSAKSQVLSAAQRIHASRQQKQADAVATEDVAVEFVQPVFRRSYSALCADEAGVPIEVMREVLNKDGAFMREVLNRDESSKPEVLSAAQRIWNSRAMMDNTPRGRQSSDLMVPHRRNMSPAA